MRQASAAATSATAAGPMVGKQRKCAKCSKLHTQAVGILITSPERSTGNSKKTSISTWDFRCVSPPKLYRCGRLVLWTTQSQSHMTLAHEACKTKWSLHRIVEICPYVLPRLIRRDHSMWHAAAWFCWQPKACRRCVADCTHKRLGF